jgi:ribosome-associated toxin RatA of RatAB toxin-antitoxin module
MAHPALSIHRRRLLAAASASLLCIGRAAAEAEAVVSAPPAVPDEAVTVSRLGSTFTVDAVMQVAVPPALAYAVLVDFEHMTRYVPNLLQSQVLQRSADGLTVRQRGSVQWGLFTLKLDSTRELHLNPPNEIRGQAISGSFKRMASQTQLAPQAGGGTQIRYHAEGEPGDWFPPFIGPAVVRRQTATQFSAMVAEMLRRQATEDAARGVLPSSP